MITTKVSLQLVDQTVPAIIPVVQGDTGRSIIFEPSDFTIPEGATATYYIQKPSGEAVYNSAEITGNTVVCNLTAQSIIETGENNLQVRIILGEDIVTSFDAILMVRPFRGIGAVESKTEINIFDKAVEEAEQEISDKADEIIAEKVPEIEALAEEVIESIPEDYTQLSNDVDDLKADITQLGYMTFTNNQKSAILDAFRHVAWSGTDGQEYIDAMEAAFDTTPTLKSLTAVSDGTTIPANATMAEVKETLTVTAVTSDDVSIIVPDSAYNLTGTLTIGSCALTVAYGGLTATVTVTVGKPSLPEGYTGYSYLKHSSNAPTTGGAQLGIHTDIALKSEYTIDVDIKYSSSSASSICICGTKSSASAKEFALYVTPSTGKLGYWYGGTDTTNEFTPLVRDVNNHITAQPVGVSETYPDYATLRVADTDYSTGSTASGEDWSSWFGIWAYATSATGIRESGIFNVGLRVGDIIVKDSNGNYVYYLTPASDGTHYGFYDLINGKFYYNETYASNFEGVA